MLAKGTVNQRKSTKNIIFYLKRDYALYILLLFPMIYYIVFKYVPMYGVTIAFKDYNLFKGVMGSEWVGLDVFREVFAMKDFYQVVRNTLLLNFLDLLFGFPAPIVLAILLNEVGNQIYKRISQTIVYLPHFLSWVIIGGMVYQIFSTETGLVNIVLRSLGLNSIPFLAESKNWIITYVSVGIWQSMGWGTIIYLAAITGINSELYEAAEVDGAGRLRKIWHITLPGIKPTIIILLILNVGRVMTIGFDRPYILGNPLVADYSNVISVFVYNYGLKAARYSLATAVGLFQSVVSIVFLLTTNYLARKTGEQGIW